MEMNSFEWKEKLHNIYKNLCIKIQHLIAAIMKRKKLTGKKEEYELNFCSYFFLKIKI